MSVVNWIIQNPAPGSHLLKYQGNTQTFTLTLNTPVKGTAWLRTNIGHGDATRNEIINQVEKGTPSLGRDWFDTHMIQMDDTHFKITLPLSETGHFEAKCLFLEKGNPRPVWPGGPNTSINVEPSYTLSGNIIYNAFVRQFGPNKSTRSHEMVEEIKTLEKQNYHVIPPSGRFRDLIKELDFIMGELGCNIIQLLPIHPTPTTYGRMGRFGSPYAALSFTDVDPALAEFDPEATPLEQFIELMDAVHERNGKIFMDIAINHTGWAANLHESNPQWLDRDPNGRIEVPGAWGVQWEDLTKLDYTHKDLWQYMANIFLTWCRRGVDGFRCDAGYMIPIPAWTYIIAKVKNQFPLIVFMIEGLGGKISVTRKLLDKANFNWGYSELFQNYSQKEIVYYLSLSNEISTEDGVLVHFAETHDNNRLASRSKTYAKMRTALCAMLSHQGTFGFANGVEWYATEKINVHDSTPLNWGDSENLVQLIKRLNHILKNHPAFENQTRLKWIHTEKSKCLALLRHHLPTGKKVFILVNLDENKNNDCVWRIEKSELETDGLVDLISDKEYSFNSRHNRYSCTLSPGQVLCLAQKADQSDLFEASKQAKFSLSLKIHTQSLRAKALSVFQYYNGIKDLGDFDILTAARELHKNPLEFCRKHNPHGQEIRAVTWNWPSDAKREVMIPPNHFLLIRSDNSFRARIEKDGFTIASEDSITSFDGYSFALFSPIKSPLKSCRCRIYLSVYKSGQSHHSDSSLLLLAPHELVPLKTHYNRRESIHSNRLFLDTNGRGAMLRASLSWGQLKSRYDALLAGNLDPENPSDRWIMLTRCRVWLVYQGYSHSIGDDHLVSFYVDQNSRGIWQFKIPSGQGQHVQISLGLEMVNDKNAIHIYFYRHASGDKIENLKDNKPIQLIIRPDIENRSYHNTNKAYMGPENHWPGSIHPWENGFSFTPDQDHQLRLQISQGDFISEPEWNYMVFRSQDAERGLDPDSDLFSPGYFSVYVQGRQGVVLNADINEDILENVPISNDHLNTLFNQNVKQKNRLPSGLLDGLKSKMSHYLVKRDKHQSVIAGFPWFLDWGRDSLIFTRGLIAGGMIQEAQDVITQFAQFEKDGTIPNMIQGDNTENRDTSDAPLWLILACSELVNMTGDHSFLQTLCGRRAIRDILLSIGNNYISGTFNQIKMDADTGLIFSPSHFSWMDTNYPAGTPRQGFPIEIQALWFAALSFLCKIDPDYPEWKSLLTKVQNSVLKLFYLKENGYFSDCLHADPGVAAHQAEPDDTLRPNQLLAITLKLVDDKTLGQNILESCEALLVPGAIRSLADRPVKRKLEIFHHGKLINDPLHPYQGGYTGDEDTHRKPAYHNGSAWTWIFPSFCEAWASVFKPKGIETAKVWLESSRELFQDGCIGHMPEILDGDFPHSQKGCDAQAWGLSEWLRVWLNLRSHT